MSGPTLVWNTIKSGQTVPLKFNIYETMGGTARTNVADVSSFTAFEVACTAGIDDPVALNDTDYFNTTGGTTLRYDGAQFIQNWQTPKRAGICLMVTMNTVDGFLKAVAFFKTK